MQALINVRLYDYHTYLENAYILFDQTIHEVGEMKHFTFKGETIDGKGQLVLPGLINFHTHMYSTFARGLDFKCQPHDFQAVLDGMWWKLDRALSLEDIEASARVYAQESLTHGVVGIIDHHASRTLLGSTQVIEEALKASGLHGLTCFETSDRFSVEEALEENRQMIKRTGGPFGLHASLSLSDDTLKKVSAVSGDHPIHCHVSEALCDQNHYQKTPIERLKAHGLLNKGSLLAHCVHITPQDAKDIKDHGAVVVVNPRSNLNNAVGHYNYALIKQYDLPLVVGTDGLGCDMAKSWQDMYFIGKATTHDPSGMGLTEVKERLSTSYDLYASWTGLRLGRFQKGYRMDAILVPYTPYTPVTIDNVFAHVFFGVFDNLHVNCVWIGGKTRLKEGVPVNPITVNHQQVASLWKRIEADHEHES